MSPGPKTREELHHPEPDFRSPLQIYYDFNQADVGSADRNAKLNYVGDQTHSLLSSADLGDSQKDEFVDQSLGHGSADASAPGGTVVPFERSLMRDGNGHIAPSEWAFKDGARALLDRNIPTANAALREKAVELITMVMRDYQAGETDKLQKLAAVADGTMIAAKKVGGVLPELPAGYKWPEEKFRGSPEANKTNAIVDFLERVWTPIIRLGLIHRGHLGIVDESAALGIDQYVYNNGGERRTLPDHVFIAPQRKRGPDVASSKDEGGADAVFKEAAQMASARGVAITRQHGNSDSGSIDVQSLPAGVDAWPVEKFDDAPERGKKGGIIKFLRRVWQPLIDAGVVSRPVLTKIDGSAEKAVRNYMQNNGNPRSLPDDLFIPTIKQANDAEIARVGLSKEDLRRLTSAVNRRAPG